MEDATQTFSRLQPRLLGAAYRMLGSMAEAEDVVQDTWLRWHDADHGAIDNAEAWLVATTTRRAIDRLRSAHHHREQYVGIWLPEPVLTDGPTTPEQLSEISSDLSIAFLTVLERLSPEARAAFLLHEVFDADYAQIAQALDKNEAACRQIVHRAKAQLLEDRKRYVVTPDAHQRLLRRFADALSRGDFAGLREMLADSAILMGDGGGVVTSFPEPMVGGARIAQLLFAPTLRPENDTRIEVVRLNGEIGLLRFMHGELESAQSYVSDGERILRIYVQRNPEKLRRIRAHRALHVH
jgi:RNA polymerase sigma-70 factor (TIGR02957 family)